MNHWMWAVFFAPAFSRLEQRAKGMTESMPADVLVDTV
jgi:hypothetical protein